MRKLILGTLLLTSLAGLPQANAQSFHNPKPPVVHNPAPAYVSYISADMMDSFVDLVNGMRAYVTPLEFAKTYSPLRSKALKCKAFINTYGLASARTNKALQSLSDYVLSNEEELDRLWEIDAFYETANTLFTIALQLDRDLQ